LPTATPTATPTAPATATPTPTPTPTATPTTAAGIVLNPTSLSFIYNPQENTGCSSANAAQTFTASETGFSGSFAAVSSNTTLATVTASSTGQFTVTPSANDKTQGTSVTITVSDGGGRTANETVTFSLNGVCLP
jgi:hypothetical protein